MKTAPGIRTNSQALLATTTIALAVAWAGCGGGGGGEPQQPDQQMQSGAQQPAAQQQPGGTQQLIDELLGDINGPGAQAQSGVAPNGQPPGQAQPQPAVAPPSSGSSDGMDTFAQDMARIQQTVPGWDNGTGITVKFLKEATGKRLSLIFVDPTPPVLKDGPGLWMIQGKATASGSTLGHIVMLLKELSPGRYQGNPSQKDFVLAVCMGEEWNGKDPDTTWSINPGSWAEITLRPGRAPGDLEGEFRGKLVDNDGDGYHTVETGYIYINR